MVDIGTESVLAMAAERGIRMVDLRFSDLIGGCHHVTIPVQGLTHKLFEFGVAFDSSAVPGFKGVEGGDMTLVPDPTTVTIDPFSEQPTLALTCWIRESDSLAPHPSDPRQIALKAEAAIASTGVADRSLWGPEFEFYVFDHVASVNNHNTASYEIESVQGHWNTGQESECHLGQRIPYQAGYHAMPPLDTLHDLRSLMVSHVIESGIPVRYHHHEVGGAGQCEIEIEFLPLLKAADAVLQVKHLVRMAALRAGKTATFMPKPLTDEAGSGLHFHQMLFLGDKPSFYDEQGYAGLSRTALFYIGGLLTHAPAVLALTNPSTNSFKRLVPGFEAPTRMFFGLANRSAAIRIPKQSRTPAEKRFEFRPPDATCHPHLAMAAQVLAGLDGIKNQIDPSAAGFGPFDANVFSLPQEQRDRIPSLPVSLEAALEALRTDHQFLLPGEVFPSNFVDVWVDYKRRHDVEPMRKRTHPFEVELYYDV